MLTSSLERAAQINMVAPVNEVFMINGTEMPEPQVEKGDTLIESDTCRVAGLDSYVDGFIKKGDIVEKIVKSRIGKDIKNGVRRKKQNI